MKYILIYYLMINLVTFIDYGRDKRRAQRDEWRISENHLLNLSLFGGALGGLMGMHIFHHKTRKSRFWIVNLIMLVIHISALTAVSQIRPGMLTH